MGIRIILITTLFSLLGCSVQGQHTEIDENDTIVSFSFSSGGGMDRFGGFGYEIKETPEGKVHFLFDERRPWEKEFTLDDHSVFDSLQKVIIEYKMYQYSGFYKPNMDIRDGESWDFSVRYASGKTLGASGYMAGPKGYGEAFNALHACLKKWKEMPVETNGVVSFTFHYGDDTYGITPQDGHALLTLDNETTGVHQRFEKDSRLFEDLRVLFLEYGLKMNAQRDQTREDCTLWDYEINYSNGERYQYFSADCGYKCGYTVAILGMLSRWMKEQPE